MEDRLATAPSPPAPPFSIQGAFAGLRAPTFADLFYACKVALAITLALYIGFSQNLDNPYWAGLTICIIAAQPQTDAIRSKAIFRLYGTVGGGALAILLAALFASHIGVLFVTSAAAIVFFFWLKQLDRTPANYTWYAVALTIAITGMIHAQDPPTIFNYTTARVGETLLGIFSFSLVDGLLFPRPSTPLFLKAMTDWRAQAADWTIAALSPDAGLDVDARLKRRMGLRKLSALLTPLDAMTVQLPYDAVAVPPRAHDLRYLRMLVVHLIAHLTAANIWIESGRRGGAGAPVVEEAATELRTLLSERPDFTDPSLPDHAARGEALAGRLAARANAVARPGDRAAVMQAGVLFRLSELATYWGRLEQVMRAVATGRRMPPAVRAEARRARPVRSIDYLVAAIDAVPLAATMGTILILWYFTAWTGAINALVFAFVICAFTIGTPGATRSARGMFVWVSFAFVFAFGYLFVALPRVTAFPVLIAMLASAIVPFIILMQMSPAMLLVIAPGFAFLGLQNAYAADFQSSLQSLLGSLSGCVISIAALSLFQFDRPRFRARRLARAVDRDVVDTARSRRTPDRARVLSLAVDRFAMFFSIVDALPDGDPLKGIDLVARLRVAANLLALRENERSYPPPVREAVVTLRLRIAAEYGRREAPDREALLPLVEAAYDALLAEPEGDYRREGLTALTGLRVGLTPDPAFEARMRGGAG